MKQPRFAALDAALVCMPCVLAFGQGYPAKPVRILVGFAPGGGTAIMARAVGAKISESLEQQFVIETALEKYTKVANAAKIRGD